MTQSSAQVQWVFTGERPTPHAPATQSRRVRGARAFAGPRPGRTWASLCVPGPRRTEWWSAKRWGTTCVLGFASGNAPSGAGRGSALGRGGAGGHTGGALREVLRSGRRMGNGEGRGSGGGAGWRWTWRGPFEDAVEWPTTVGLGTQPQPFLYQEWPKSLCPCVNCIFPRNEIWVRRGGGGGSPPRDASEGKAPQRRRQKPLDRCVEEIAKVIWGGYCRLQMLALGVRGTGHRLGALKGGGGGTTPLQCIPAPPPPPLL